MRDRNRSSFQQESTKLPVSASNQLFHRISFIRHARMQCYTMQNRSVQFNSTQLNSLQIRSVQFSSVQFNSSSIYSIQPFNSFHFHLIQFCRILINSINSNEFQLFSIPFSSILSNSIQFSFILFKSDQLDRSVKFNWAQSNSRQLHTSNQLLPITLISPKPLNPKP